MPTDEVDFDEIDFDAVIAAERALLDPQVRANPEAVSALLDDRFVEYGARGAVWDHAGRWPLWPRLRMSAISR